MTTFKVGDEVRLSAHGVLVYADMPNNPHDTLGVIIVVEAGKIFPISVEWVSGLNNWYSELSLILMAGPALPTPTATEEHTGGSSSYYDLVLPEGGEVRCLDVIEALELTYAEANVVKAIWRTAAARQGKKKKGNNDVYDAEKCVFYSERMLVAAKRGDV